MGRTGTAGTAAAGKYHHGDLRQALLAAAEIELAEKGVEGFTLRGCARRAGVSHAAPAHHFRDADALLTELAAEGYARFAEVMRRRQAQSQGPRTALIAAGLGYVDFARANPALFRLMFSSARPDFDQQPLRANADAAFGILVGGVREIRGASPMATREGIQDVLASWAIVHGLANFYIAERMPLLAAVPEADREAFLADIIARALPKGG